MAPTAIHNVLKATALSIGYFHKKSPLKVADQISFECQKGQLIGIVGANGIGKSTLLRTLSGMQKKLSGAIYLNENPLENYHTLDLATQISLVLTEAPNSKNLRVQEFVSLGRYPYTNWLGKLSPKDLEKVDWAIQLTETQNLISKKCFELSDGQFQRVAIARALAQDTPLILMDEPTTHLDLYHRAYLLKLLKKLTQETEKTILFSTHEIDLALQLSDLMMVLTKDGFYYDTPSRLIAEHRFQELFPEEMIHKPVGLQSRIDYL